MFTDEELRLNLLEPSNRSNRGALDPIRVRLIQNALRRKYNTK